MAGYTTSELIEGSKHLHYEIKYMEKDLELMRSIHAAEKSPLKQYLNPYFNSFCVHASVMSSV
jgi:hypothetical protein